MNGSDIIMPTTNSAATNARRNATGAVSSAARSNNGYLGQDDPVLHFGLGERKQVVVVVTFLDGMIVNRSGVNANQTIVIDGRMP